MAQLFNDERALVVERFDKSRVVCRDRSVSRQANRFEVTSVEIEVCYADALRRSSDRLQLQK